MDAGRRSTAINPILMSILVLTLGPSAPVIGSGGAADRAPSWESPRPAARSGDDGGFSILLTSPREAYLLGEREIVIKPTVPEGDAITQVDFFVNGRLLQTSLEPPYSCEVDFGEEIRRHTIVVRARTREGRLARVSFISRSSSLTDGSDRPLEVVPVIVRDASGRPVRGLSLSDFTLLENGRRQRIVHFDDRPVPASIAIVIDAGSSDEPARLTLLRGASTLARALPPYHAIALFDTWDDDPDGGARGAADLFSYHRPLVDERLERARSLNRPASGPHPLEEALDSAARALEQRTGDRVLLVLTSPTPVPSPEEMESNPARELPIGASGEDVAVARHKDDGDGGDKWNDGDGGDDGDDGRPEERSSAASESPLTPAVERLKRARVTVFTTVHAGSPQMEEVAVLGRTAEETGGEIFFATIPTGVEDACARISEALLHQYRVCYHPENPEGPGWRTIQLEVSRPDVDVKARRAHPPGGQVNSTGESDQEPAP